MAYHITIHKFCQLKVYIQQQKNKNFQHFTTWLTIHKHEKAKLWAALWKYLNAHFLYTVDEVWAMCKVDVLGCFVKCFIVIYNVKMCVCVFMTSSTSYSLCDTLMEIKSV
jgi:sensor histidine kinase YesM